MIDTKWETTQFTTEYLIYDVEADNIIIMVFSQGASSYYIEYKTWSGYDVVNYNDNSNIFFNDRYIFLGVI